MTKKYKYLSRKTRDSLVEYFQKIVSIIKQPEMGVLPGQLAFFILLSLVPILTFVGYGAGIFNINLDTVINLLDEFVPGGVANIVPYIVGGGQTMDIKLIILTIWMIYIASNGFNSVILISNQIYGINKSNWFKRRLKAVFMTIGAVLMLIGILVIPIYGSQILSMISKPELYEMLKNIYNVIKSPLIVLIVFVFVRITYQVSPDRVRKHAHLLTGSIFTTFGWIFVTWLYSILANNMSTYNLFYGALASVAFLMIWLYFISLIFVIGMSLNYGREIEEQTLEKTGAIKIVKKH